jgi:hypothetical protein
MTSLKNYWLLLLNAFICVYSFTQNETTIDEEKVKSNLKFCMLQDTTTLGDRLKIVYGDNYAAIQQYTEDAIANYPTYYNSLAMTLFSQNINRLEKSGYVVLKESNFDECFQLHGKSFNCSGSGTSHNLIDIPPSAGHLEIYDKIVPNELSFRIPKTNSELCIDGLDIYSTDLISVNNSSNTFELESGVGKCLNGYPILVKENMNALFNKSSDYFELMSDNFQISLYEKIVYILSKQVTKNIDQVQTIRVSGDYSIDGKYHFDVVSNNLDFNRSLQSYLYEEFIAPRYKGKYLKSEIDINLQANMLMRTDLSKKVDDFENFINITSSNNDFLRFKSIANGFVLKKGEDIDITAYKLNYNKVEITLKSNFFPGNKLTDDFSKKILRISSLKKPSYSQLAYSLFGLGNRDFFDLKKISKNAGPIISIAMLTLSGGCLLGKQIYYGRYLVDVSTLNNIKTYRLANSFQKGFLIFGGVYTIGTLSNIIRNSIDIHKKRKIADEFNLYLNENFPSGYEINSR